MIKIPNRIKDIWEYCKENNIPMLSDFTADFWEVYTNNYEYFDKLFMKTYRGFVAFTSDYSDIEDNVEDWIEDVYSWLLANSKRYSELWRLQDISDIDYSILDNYNVRETHRVETSDTKVDTIGQRSDSKSNTITHGTITKRDDTTNVNGAKTVNDNRTLKYDSVERNTSVDTTIGSQQNTTENKVSADNENTYAAKDYSDTDLGSREDTSDTHDLVESRTDTDNNAHTEAAYTDTEKYVGTVEHANDTEQEQITYGSHIDRHTDDGEESRTVTRRGNIGVFSASKLLSEHKELWEAFNFYKMIFDEIANEFLRIIY